MDVKNVALNQDCHILIARFFNLLCAQSSPYGAFYYLSSLLTK